MGSAGKEEPPFPLTEVDKWVLSQTDEEYKYHDWEELRQIIETNNLSVLKRKPSDLRRYMKWTAETKTQYGSMTNYLMAHRLPKAWNASPNPASLIPFEDPSDYRVLINDWPYGCTPDITHIVVWSRTLIPIDPDSGDMTQESRRTVESFVKRYFVKDLGPGGGEERVMWFKNWVALQSVRSLEHIHVLVKDVEPALLAKWTKEHELHRP